MEEEHLQLDNHYFEFDLQSYSQPTQSRLQVETAVQPTCADCYSSLEQIDKKITRKRRF